MTLFIIIITLPDLLMLCTPPFSPQNIPHLHLYMSSSDQIHNPIHVIVWDFFFFLRDITWELRWTPAFPSWFYSHTQGPYVSLPPPLRAAHLSIHASPPLCHTLYGINLSAHPCFNPCLLGQVIFPLLYSAMWRQGSRGRWCNSKVKPAIHARAMWSLVDLDSRTSMKNSLFSCY